MFAIRQDGPLSLQRIYQRGPGGGPVAPPYANSPVMT